MRQATLPWAAAAPPPSIRPEHHLALQHHLADHLEQLDPVLLEVDTPPYHTSTPPLPHELDPALDPALFSSSQDDAAANVQVVDISTPEPIPTTNPDTTIDMTTSSSASSSSTGATSSIGIPASTQQTHVSSAPETQAVLTAEPAETASTLKSLPPLHPFFRLGGASTHSTDSNDESDTEHKRPTRSSRTKAPVSYREDLKAVLRADAAQESARIKEEKRQAKLEASAAKKALRSVKGKPRQPRSNGNSDAEDFELLETRVVSPAKSSGAKANQLSGETASTESSSSSSKPHQPSRYIEPKPLSLAVKGTGAVATANPHPFFVKKPKQQPIPPIDVDSVSSQNADNNDTTRDNKGKAPATTSTFDAAPASWSLFSTQRAPSSKPKKPLHAPWPTLEDTHVAGLLDSETRLLSHARSDLAQFRSRWASRPSSSTTTLVDPAPAPDFVSQLNRTRPQPHLANISLTSPNNSTSLTDLLSHISTSKVSPESVASAAHHADTCRSTGQLWTDAFRPRLASACLGNERNAGYLRDWLRRLLVAAPGSVRTTDSKRKHAVQRRVDRRRKKRARRGYSDDDEDESDDLTDFIVDDDDDEDAVGEWDDEAADEQWFGKFATIDRASTASDDECVDVKSSQGTTTESKPVEATPRADAQPDAPQHTLAPLDRLTNCMLLTGPTGSGKTASVYACAAELGYEVFELYPGMGKRSGKELLAAVGDLARNHMVSSGGVGGGATFNKPLQPNASGAVAAAVRQSLILIEEADVLFEEDKGFWAAVVELVAESKRPVVVVCNELELVPVHDLPVQQVLEYTKPRVFDQVVPWLQTVAAHMGRCVTPEQLQTMLRHLPSTLPALETDDEPRADLRQALHQLQFGHLSHAPSQPHDHLATLAASSHMDTKTLACAADSFSAVDIFEHAHAAEHDAFGDAGVDASSSSRQWGAWMQLVPSPLASVLQRRALGGVGGAPLEYRSAMAQMHAAVAVDGDAGAERGQEDLLERLQQRHAARLHTLIAPLLTPLRHTSSLVPPCLITDYAPMVRLITLVDEDLAHIHASLRLEQQQADSPPTAAGRSTRNSTRAAALTSWLTGTPAYGYERWLGAMGPEQVRVAQMTRLAF
ncbi:uncharacterized protein SRS1_11337 [Sporisorium reilianum f. sp. reilianum]|uniref:AAA+ ATPase domain-containing protein n=1 Tax=Sporisorium reilianum f. sp. reilianum TaxID=72559 RepID=A0A2N8UP07_9BASI|nr:uncharacterized protein SRS1_11337 [Sporisorium reilianum f. sp. reilianum]